MYIIFQYPVIDFRLVTPAAKIKSNFPTWPSPELNYRPFVRHFGSVMKREFGGIDEWTGEEFYCDARRSVRYHDLHKQVYVAEDGIEVKSVNSSKRFYSDGKFMNKVELCLTNDVEKFREKSKQGGFQINIISLLKFYAQLPVRINGKSKPLFRAGKELAKLYCQSSVIHTRTKKDLQKFVIDGEVCILLIFSIDEPLQLPDQAKKINEYKSQDGKISLTLYGYTLHLEGYYLKVWIIQIPFYDRMIDSPLFGLLRNLRIVLLRVHAEKETIRALLNAMKRETIKLPAKGAKTQMVMDYLKDAHEKLFRKKRYNLEQKEVLGFALQSENANSPGSFSTLKKTIKDEFTRKNMMRFLEESYVDDKQVILFVCSSPSTKNPLDFGKDFRAITDSHDNSPDRASYDIKIKTGVRRTELGKLLGRFRPDILHISMHASEDQGLFFEDETGNASPMSPEELGDLMRIQSELHKPEIVVLSACNSLAHAKAISPYCDFVIGTSTVFPERAGVLYAIAFYDLLFSDSNTSVQSCHQAGVHAIEYANPAFKPIREVDVWNIPQLL